MKKVGEICLRLIVLSDSHRRRSTLFDIVELHKDDADMFIFLGDIDDDFDEILFAYPHLKHIRVVGNNDFSSPHPPFRETKLNGKKVYICHGHTHYVKHGYQMLVSHCQNIGADICLFGHTHEQYTTYLNGLYIMNPGAVCNGEYGIIDIVDKGVMLIPSKI